MTFVLSKVDEYQRTYLKSGQGRKEKCEEIAEVSPQFNSADDGGHALLPELDFVLGFSR